MTQDHPADSAFKTIEWTEQGVRMIDQTRLPGEETYRTYTDYREVAEAIRSMVIRGAPAIGVAAAMGIALGVKNSAAKTASELRAEFEIIAETLAKILARRKRSCLAEELAKLDPREEQALAEVTPSGEAAWPEY